MFRALKPFLIVIICLKFIYPAYQTNESTNPAELIYSKAKILASDDFLGRGTGQLGGDLASEYLIAELRKIGAVGFETQDITIQNIPFISYKFDESSLFTLHSGKEKFNFTQGKDYVLTNYGAEIFFPEPVDLVFAGYGISAPEYDYDDYFALDVEGKIVVVLSGEPLSENPAFFRGNQTTIYSNYDVKQRNALSKGAKGTIIIPNPFVDELFDWNKINLAYSFSEVSLASRPIVNFGMIINPLKAASLFTGAKYSLKEVYERYQKKRPVSFNLETKVSFISSTLQKTFLSPNIIAFHKGTDKDFKDTYIILSAHYDHLGVGVPIKGDSIYNGFTDNALGTAALLQLVNDFTNQKIKTKRSIIFIFTTGEEKGLLGALYYVNNPLVPLYKTIANVNIDGIAYFDEFEDVIAIGGGYSDLEITLKNSAEKMNSNVSKIPPYFLIEESFNRSDQFVFASEGIPSIMIYEGLKFKNRNENDALMNIVNYFNEVYHTPFDDISIEVNFNAIELHYNIIKQFVIDLANQSTEPEWLKGVEFNNAKRRNKAEKR